MDVSCWMLRNRRAQVRQTSANFGTSVLRLSTRQIRGTAAWCSARHQYIAVFGNAQKCHGEFSWISRAACQVLKYLCTYDSVRSSRLECVYTADTYTDRPIGTMEDALLNINLIAEPAYRTRKFRPKVLQPLPDEIVVRIPYEIIEHILDQIRDRKTLSACTRVCYGWHHSSRRRLFARSAVRLNTFEKISTFFDEIHSSSTKSSIIPYIQSLSMSFAWRPSGEAGTLRPIKDLAGLTSLHSLKLRLWNFTRLGHGHAYNLHPRLVNDFRRNFGHIKNLDLTLIRNPHFATCQGFVAFVSSFPKLQRLAINNCYIATMIDSEQAFQDRPPLRQLRFLEIGDVDVVARWNGISTDTSLLRWLIRAKKLTGLSIHHHYDDLTPMHGNFSFAFKAGRDKLKQIKIFPVRIAGMARWLFRVLR